jgi:hypothetical protein
LHDAELLAVGADDADLPDPDALVDTDLLCFAQRRGSSCVPATRGMEK